MKKNVVQDVVPPKRSIRNVDVPRRRGVEPAPEPVDEYTQPIAIRTEKVKKIPADEYVARGNREAANDLTDGVIRVETTPTSTPPSSGVLNPPKPPYSSGTSYDYDYDEPKSKSHTFLYASLFVFVLALAFGVSAFFKSAEIKVTPRSEERPLQASFTARKNDTSGGLNFQVVSVSGDTETSVVGGSSQKVSKKATGTIAIFNDYSSAPQKLVATTRFQTTEGLVYRLVNAVTVPGSQVKSGKTVPGSIDAIVEADKTGTSYNIGLKDFTIPGFKGDPKYTHIYGRSKTPMTGGFEGTQKIVSGDALKSANTSMEASLKDKLSKDVVTQIPADFILYPNSISYTFADAEQVTSGVASDTDQVTLRKKGTINAIIFERSSLARSIVAKVFPDVTDDMLKITNLDSLVFSLASSTGITSLTDALSFNLSGNVNAEWIFDENQLKSELLGLSKTKAREVIASHKAITEAWIQTKPFWNQTIPTDSLKVKLVNTLAGESK